MLNSTEPLWLDRSGLEGERLSKPRPRGLQWLGGWGPSHLLLLRGSRHPACHLPLPLRLCLLPGVLSGRLRCRPDSRAAAWPWLSLQSQQTADLYCCPPCSLQSTARP